MNDIEFEVLLKNAVVRAAELDYMGEIPFVGESAALILPSDRFRHRMAKLLNSPKSYVKKLRSPVYMKVLRTAAIILLAISMLLGVSMLNPDVRAAVARFFSIWFSDRTEYEVSETVSRSVPSTVMLNYLPDGFSPVLEAYSDIGIYLVYRTDDNQSINIMISGNSGRLHVDNEHTENYTTYVKDHIVDVYKSNNSLVQSVLVCYDESSNLIVSVAGTLPVNELKSILENLRY